MSYAVANGIANAFISAAWTGALGLTVGRHVWPWDWRGKRRKVVLRRDRRPFE